jgi:hypothetical protein
MGRSAEKDPVKFKRASCIISEGKTKTSKSTLRIAGWPCNSGQAMRDCIGERRIVESSQGAVVAGRTVHVNNNTVNGETCKNNNGERGGERERG